MGIERDGHEALILRLMIWAPSIAYLPQTFHVSSSSCVGGNHTKVTDAETLFSRWDWKEGLFC